MRTLSTIAAALALAGCAGPPLTIGQGVAGTTYILPAQAIMNAAAVAPAGVNGIFQMTVRSAGRRDGMVYLDSEVDYRDQRTLVVAMPTMAADALERRFGVPPDRYLIGRTIAVKDTARRIRIDFVADGHPTGKYYYQTHVLVTTPEQVSVAPLPARAGG